VEVAPAALELVEVAFPPVVVVSDVEDAEDLVPGASLLNATMLEVKRPKAEICCSFPSVPSFSSVYQRVPQRSSFLPAVQVFAAAVAELCNRGKTSEYV
jgi:hypothetical protein